MLTVVLSGVGVEGVPPNEGVVPTAEPIGVIGMIKFVLLPAGRLLGVVQFTIWPVVVQPQPLTLANVGGAVMPVGNVVTKVIGPLAVALPMLLTLTGSEDV